MADTVDTAFVPAFQNVIVGLYAEDPDQLQSTVRLRTGVVGKTDNWERLGGVKLVPVTSRHQATPHTEMTHSRRRAQMSDRAGSEKLDDLDTIKQMIDPRNEYTQNLVRAYRVFIAETLVDALNAAATVVANDDSTTTQALQASQQIANGGTGFTMAKWRQANRILDTAVLTGGTLDPILPKTGNIRSCFLYHHDAIGLSIGMVAKPEVDRLPEHLNSWQVMVKCSAGPPPLPVRPGG